MLFRSLVAGLSRRLLRKFSQLPWKSVIDNVGLGLKGQWRDAARRALAAVGLENRAGEWPAALSGGQKQRVALARALIHRPGLLLLDEPLGALDALTRLEMQDLIVSLWQEHGFTVLLVTHDVSEAVAMADRVLLIEEGKIGLDLTVDIPRPRRLGSVRLAELEAEVLQRVMQRGESDTEYEDHEVSAFEEAINILSAKNMKCEKMYRKQEFIIESLK